MLSQTVTPGQPLTSLQKTSLAWIARLHGGKDVVFAIDLTGSVGLNDSGRTRLSQIVENSLQPGDSVYVIPFASGVYFPKTVIQFNNKQQISELLKTLPSQADPILTNTDIQQAELGIYQYLAQRNQQRLYRNQPIKSQSVVWITDAPLFTKLNNGCRYSTNQDWIETPAHSPFRNFYSPESQLRAAWLQALCPVMNKRSLALGNYNLTIVDIAPTVQESCTPAPSGQSICLVNPYLVRQLWLPSLVLAILSIAIFTGVLRYFWWHLAIRKKWCLRVNFDSQPERDERVIYLASQQSISIGIDDPRCIDAIDCPGSEVRAYLERRGNQLYLEPTGAAPIYCNEQEITKRTKLKGTRLQLNCPDNRNFDFYIVIRISQ